MQINQTNQFKKSYKKLHKNQKTIVNKYIKEIVNNPLIGDPKKGDLSGISVCKFKVLQQLMLLAYEYYGNKIVLTLISLGAHENFYHDLKNY